MEIYAAINCDNYVRMESSSGGIFSAIADEYEVKYGVAMSADGFSANVVRCEKEIDCLRGSKYFQAKVGDAFLQVREDLEQGKSVLFSGTGCQINGLKCFLGVDYPNLLCVDVVCHGVPSPKLWRKYLSYFTGGDKSTHDVRFRDKCNGWKYFELRIDGKGESHRNNVFMRMFLRNYCLRPSCYECHAKEYNMADISLADFWGVDNVVPDMNDDKGTSLIIIRTNKGQDAFEKVKPYLEWKEVDFDNAVKYNISIISSVERPVERDSFYKDLNNKKFEKIVKKYAKDIKLPLVTRVIRKISRIIMKYGQYT